MIGRFEIISCSCSDLSNELKERIDFIPWDKIVEIKCKLINDELEVDTEKVWEIINEDLPILKDDIKKVIDDLDQNNIE